MLLLRNMNMLGFLILHDLQLVLDSLPMDKVIQLPKHNQIQLANNQIQKITNCQSIPSDPISTQLSSLSLINPTPMPLVAVFRIRNQCGEMDDFDFTSQQPISNLVDQNKCYNTFIVMENLSKTQLLKQYQTPNPQPQFPLIPKPPISLKTDLNSHKPSSKTAKLQLPHNARIHRDRFASTLQSLTSKYFINLSVQELEQLVQKAVKLKSTLLHSIFDVELAAAVFYYFYADRIGIHTTLYFCKRNSLKTKRFNRMYILCRLYFRNQRSNCNTQIANISCKGSDHEENEEEDSKKETNGQDVYYQNTHIKKPHKVTENMSPLEAIDLIYDYLFNDKYFQDNRRQIILKIVEKYEQTNPAIIEAIDWTDNPLLKIYHIVIYYFKKFGAPCCLTDVKVIIFQRLRLQFTMEGYYAMIRVFKKFDKQAQEQDG